MIQVYEYDENFILTKPVPIEPDEDGNYMIPERIVQPFSLLPSLSLCFIQQRRYGRRQPHRKRKKP